MTVIDFESVRARRRPTAPAAIAARPDKLTPAVPAIDTGDFVTRAELDWVRRELEAKLVHLRHDLDAVRRRVRWVTIGLGVMLGIEAFIFVGLAICG